MMAYLLHIFQYENDVKVISAVRIIGNIAFSCDALIENLINDGFVSQLGLRLLNAGSALTSEIFWAISNIVGSQNRVFIDAVLTQPNVWRTILQSCYSSDIRLRREALFCTINIVSFFVDEELDQAYQDFFGNLIVDVIGGFTAEPSTALATTILSYFVHVIDHLKLHSHLYESMILEFNLKAAVEHRFRWCQRMLAAGDLTLDGCQFVREIFVCCILVLA